MNIKAHVQNEPRARGIVENEEFADQSLMVKDKSLWCQACSAFVSFEKNAKVRRHCYKGEDVGALTDFAALAEAEKKKLGHYKKLVPGVNRKQRRRPARRSFGCCERSKRAAFSSSRMTQTRGPSFPRRWKLRRWLLVWMCCVLCLGLE